MDGDYWADAVPHLSNFFNDAMGSIYGDDSDPALGNPHFVSSDRIASTLNRLSWFSTTPYLSVIVASFTPNRLVVDPAGNYFWLSCATATANEKATRSTPQARAVEMRT